MNKMAKKQSYVGKGVSKLLSVIGGIIVILIVISLLANHVRVHVPYVLTPRSSLNNPNRFNQNFVYDETDSWWDYKDVCKNAVKKVFEETGLQIYYLYMYVPEDVHSNSEMINYMRDYIDGNISDPYGVYVLRSSYADYNSTYEVGLYNEIVYGDYAQDFMDSTASRVYSAAYEKYYSGNAFTYYSSEECVALGFELMASRLIHPFVSLLSAGVRYALIIGVCIVVGLLIRKVNTKHRRKEILDTPMKDLIAEHAEDLKDKYE